MKTTKKLTFITLFILTTWMSGAVPAHAITFGTPNYPSCSGGCSPAIEVFAGTVDISSDKSTYMPGESMSLSGFFISDWTGAGGYPNGSRTLSVGYPVSPIFDSNGSYSQNYFTSFTGSGQSFFIPFSTTLTTPTAPGSHYIEIRGLHQDGYVLPGGPSWSEGRGNINFTISAPAVPTVQINFQ